MSDNNWSAGLLAIQRTLDATQHYANQGRLDDAITAVLSIEPIALRVATALQAEQLRRAELEAKG